MGSLATIAVGSVRGIADIPSFITDVATAGEKFVKVHDTMAQMNDLGAAIKMFQRVRKAVNLLHDEVKNILNPSNNNKITTLRRNPEPESRNVITAWDTFSFETFSQLNIVILAGVSDADNYSLAIKKQVEFEKNYYHNTLALFKARRSYAQAENKLSTLQTRFEESQKTIEKLEKDRTVFNIKCSHFFDQFLLIRNDIVNGIKAFRDSYRYHTLRDVPLDDLDVTKPITYLQLCYDRIKDDQVKYFQVHTTPPSSFTKYTTLAELGQNLLDVKRGLQSAKHQFAFRLDHCTPGPFKNCNLVQLSSMEVWLGGIRSVKPQAPVMVQVQTNGTYQNCDAKRNWLTFSTEPMNDAISVYPLRGYSKSQPEMLLEFGEPFIRPTPFSQWTITLLNPEEFDFAGLSSINIRWTGSAYAFLPCSAA